MTASASNATVKTASLYASLYVPDFPVAVLQRAEDRSRPAVVTCGKSPNRFVYSADAAAKACGVREGMALAAAQARYSLARESGPLRVFDRDAEQERQVQILLLGLAERSTPRFEDVSPGLLALDFGGLRGPYAAAADLASGVARLGLSANVGVSRNRFVSLCAARTQVGVTHVYPGQEAGFLCELPLDTLPLDSKQIQTLGRWGVRKIGELARLPEEQLAERFGSCGARMARLARGEEGSALRPYQPPELLELGEDFDWEIEEIEPLALTLSGLLDRLCLRLHGLDQAAERLTTQLRLVGGGVCERTIDLPYPLSDSRTLLTLVRTDLATHPPGCAIEGVRVLVKPTGRRRVQQSLFATDLPNPEDLAVTLARLTGIVGDERVGAPAVPDTYRPGVATLEAFRPAKEKPSAGRRAVPKSPLVAVAPGLAATRPAKHLQERHGQSCPPTASPPPRSSLVFRCFRPSRPAEVTLIEDRPARVEAQDARGSVTACAGPWRVSGEWWTPDGWQYQEWDIEVAGRLYRACCERTTGEWFLAGEYD